MDITIKRLTPELVEDYLHFLDAAPHDDGIDENFCYVIAPEMQRKGIATKLLERVCADAQMEGFDIVESYPKKEFVNVARDFMGPSSMYKKMGFTIYKELGQNEVIMRKSLK